MPRINQLPATQSVGATDVVAVDTENGTKRAPKSTLFDGYYTAAEVDEAIAQSTADLNFSFGVNDDTWSEIYTILSPLEGTVKSALFIAQGVPAGVLTGGKLNIAIKGIVNRAGTGIYDFIAFTGYQPQYIWVWRIAGFTSGSVTPTVNTVYRFTGTAI